MINIRAICTDIDGTLLDSNRQLSKKTIEVISSLKETIPVVLASSRMPSAMTHLQAELGITDHPLVCYNGGFVIRKTAGETKVFTSVMIPLEICRSIVELANGTDVHISLYFEDEWHAPRHDAWTEREARITKVTPVIESAEKVFARWSVNGNGAHKVMCMGPEDQINILAERLQKKHHNDIHVYWSRATYLELAPKSISKATGIRTVLETEYGISMREVLSFGDNYNDIEMLEQSGFGVAVSNAREEVKAVADEITGRSVEDGVANALLEYTAYLKKQN